MRHSLSLYHNHSNLMSGFVIFNMKSILYQIQRRTAFDEGHTLFMRAEASLSNFELDSGQIVEPDIFLKEGGWSLYGVQDGRFMLVQLPLSEDITQVPFMTPHQNQHAQQLLTIPFEVAHTLVENIPAPQKIIFIHMMGRTGSTLLNKILSNVDGVCSFSEPATFRLVSKLCGGGVVDSVGCLNILRTALRLQFGAQNYQGDFHTLGIKLRHRAMDDLLIYHSAFPTAKYIFMYREAVGWMRSFYRLLMAFGVGRDLEIADGALPADARPTQQLQIIWKQISDKPTDYFSTHPDYGYLEELLAVVWSNLMNQYLRGVEQGIPLLAVNFKDFTQDRHATLQEIFSFVGLDAQQIDRVMQVYEADSQAGTEVGREGYKHPITDAQVKRLLAYLSLQQGCNMPDYTL